MSSSTRRQLLWLGAIAIGMILVSLLFTGPTAYIVAALVLIPLLVVGAVLSLVEPRPRAAKR